MPIVQVSNGTNLVIDNRIMKILTETGADKSKVIYGEECGSRIARITAGKGLVRENSIKI